MSASLFQGVTVVLLLSLFSYKCLSFLHPDLHQSFKDEQKGQKRQHKVEYIDIENIEDIAVFLFLNSLPFGMFNRAIKIEVAIKVEVNMLKMFHQSRNYIFWMSTFSTLL